MLPVTKAHSWGPAQHGTPQGLPSTLTGEETHVTCAGENLFPVSSEWIPRVNCFQFVSASEECMWHDMNKHIYQLLKDTTLLMIILHPPMPCLTFMFSSTAFHARISKYRFYYTSSMNTTSDRGQTWPIWVEVGAVGLVPSPQWCSLHDLLTIIAVSLMHIYTVRTKRVWLKEFLTVMCVSGVTVIFQRHLHVPSVGLAHRSGHWRGDLWSWVAWLVWCPDFYLEASGSIPGTH